MTSQRPVRVLSIDGGGVRGYSSLLIIEHIMEKIQAKYGLSDVPRPCDHFDLIGGTGTGGIIAIMLGRLGMSVDDCAKTYREVIAKHAFVPDRVPNSTLDSFRKPAFSAKRLENAMKTAIRRSCSDRECRSRQNRDDQCPHSDKLFRDGSCTKTVVLAMTKDNIDARPTLFGTYDRTTAYKSCTIWQVARATTAAVDFFESIKLGRDEIEFIDASYGHNNPCKALIKEARKLFPGRKIQALSVGAGLGDVVSLNVEKSSEAIIKALREIAASSQSVARELADEYTDTDQYFRFNVDQGLRDITLADWDKGSRISAHTHNYLNENQRQIERCVATLCEGRKYDNSEKSRVPEDPPPPYPGRQSFRNY